jgi:single-strand DNA-binding protein
MVKCIGVCRLTKDVENIRYTQSGKEIVTLNVAINNGKDDTTFLNLTAFGKLAELCKQYLNKGSLIEVEFVIKNNNYKNNEGKMVYKEQYIINEVRFLSTNKKEVEKEEESWTPSEVTFGDDMLPF